MMNAQDGRFSKSSGHIPRICAGNNIIDHGKNLDWPHFEFIILSTLPTSTIPGLNPMKQR